MSALPEEFPHNPEEHVAPETAEPGAVEPVDTEAEAAERPGSVSGHEFSRAESAVEIEGASAPGGISDLAAQHDFGMPPRQNIEPPLFAAIESPPIPRPPRVPNLGHLLILLLLAVFGLLCAGGISQVAIHYHLFGVTNTQDAIADIHYTLGSEAILYLFAL